MDKQEFQTEIMRVASELQADCHKVIDSVASKDPSFTQQRHQDATNTWIFERLAILTVQVDKLTQQIGEKC